MSHGIRWQHRNADARREWCLYTLICCRCLTAQSPTNAHWMFTPDFATVEGQFPLDFQQGSSIREEYMKISGLQ